MTDLLHKEVTGDILKAYFEAYNHSSRTYPEHISEKIIMTELRWQGYEVAQQDEYHIHYKGRLVGVQRLDLFVVQLVVVENKVVERLTALHKVQCRSYVKTVGKHVGLVLNFGSAQPEFARIYYNPEERKAKLEELQSESPKAQPADWLYPDLVYTITGGLYEVHTTLGPGFVHRIYKNACYQEFRLRGLMCQAIKRMKVDYKGEIVGEIAFGHILVDNKVMVFPVAIRDTRSIHLDNLKAWMRMNGIQLGILTNFNAVRLEIVYVRA
jgi:GxxExxY protein